MWKVEILKGKPVTIQSEEEKVRCDLLTLLKYGINFSEKKYRLFSNHIIGRIIGRLSDLREPKIIFFYCGKCWVLELLVTPIHGTPHRILSR